MLTRDGFKTLVPIDGISLQRVGEPDPEMQRYADSEVTGRVKTDVRKDLAARLAEADQYLVVDNSGGADVAPRGEGRLYTLLAGEATELMDTCGTPIRPRASWLAVKLLRRTHRQPEIDLRLFHPACLDSFDPAGSWSGPTLRGFGSLRTARSRRPTSTGATHDSSRRWTTTSSSRPAAVRPAPPWLTSHLRSNGRPSTPDCGGRSRRTWSSSAPRGPAVTLPILPAPARSKRYAGR